MKAPSHAGVLVVLFVATGCGDEHEPASPVHALGNVDAFGRPGETTLFAHYVSTLDDESCEVLDETSGCVLTRCEPSEAAPFEDAGEVIVGDDALDIAEDSSYSLVVPEELVAGEQLSLEASGSSAVPKHSGEVTVPERTTVTVPALDDPLLLDPSVDLVVEFDPVDSDRVVLSLLFEDLAVSCVTAGSSDRLTVPARLIDSLPTDVPGAFNLVNENLAESTVSGWRIWFGAHHVIAEGTAELGSAP